MFGKIVTIIFYAALAFWAFGVGIPYLMIIIGVSAAILAILAAL